MSAPAAGFNAKGMRIQRIGRMNRIEPARSQLVSEGPNKWGDCLGKPLRPEAVPLSLAHGEMAFP